MLSQTSIITTVIITEYKGNNERNSRGKYTVKHAVEFGQNFSTFS